MSFEYKYKENETWAESAYREKAYEVAINRYYYSIFQRMLHKLGKDGIKIQYKYAEENSHSKTSRTFVEKYISTDKPKDKFRFNKEFERLKAFRHEADYEYCQISESIAKKAKESYEKLKKIIN